MCRASARTRLLYSQETAPSKVSQTSCISVGGLTSPGNMPKKSANTVGTKSRTDKKNMYNIMWS